MTPILLDTSKNIVASHIAYATNSTGTTGFSTSDSTNKTYIGMYVDNIEADSTDPSKYNWTLIEGANGADGIPGTPGVDGKTPYFHIAYADSADGKDGFYVGGGTNLLTGTGNHTVTGTMNNGYLSNETTDDFLTLFKGLEGQTVTASVDYEYSGFVAGSGENYIGWWAAIVTDSTLYKGIWYTPKNDSGSGRTYSTFVVPQNITSVKESRGYIRFSGSGTGTVSHLKLEKGSVATPWSPAPSEAHPTYMGTYTDYTQADSLDPTSYKWTLIKGSDIHTVAEFVGDKTNGIGRLIDASNCTVSEERNGAFTATFDYPITGKYYKNIDVDSLVKIKPNEDTENQIFRVAEISRPINGVCTYSLNHITYDLSKTVVTPFTAKGATQACIELKAHLVTDSPFEIQADGLNEDSTFTVSEPQSLRSLLGGQSGSMLDTFGGEYEWNNLKVILHLHRGSDNSVSIRYGKNLTDISHDTNSETMYTAIYPYAKSNETVIQGTLHTIKEALVPAVKAMDFSSYFDQEDEITADKVNAKCDSYIASNDLTAPKINIKVKFQPLAKTEEYKNIAPLEHVALCDTVHVYYPKLGVKASAKVISYEYDVLKEQYNTIELGDAKNSLSDTIADQSAAIKQEHTTTSGKISQVMQSIIDSTNSIRGGSGGYVVINKDDSGVNREILIMDTPDQQTAKNVIRANKNGIGFSNAGINGVFNSAWNIDGTFDATQINVIGLTASMFLGSTIDLGGLDNKSGVLKLRDENNNVIGTLTKDGLVMYGQDGSYVKMNNDVGFAGYDKNGIKIYWVSGDEFHMKKSVVEEEITLCGKMRFIPITIYNSDGSIKNDGIGLVSTEG